MVGGCSKIYILYVLQAGYIRRLVLCVVHECVVVVVVVVVVGDVLVTVLFVVAYTLTL